MTDEALIAQLREDVFHGDERLHNLSRHNPLHMEAADRIKALIFEVSTVVKACSDLSQQHIAEWNRAEAAEAKLAKAVEALELIVVDNTWGLEHQTYMKCRTTLAEIKGESHE